jgi:hypothetical protein
MLYHQSGQGKNMERITALAKVEDKYDWSEVSFPMGFEEYFIFEDKNQILRFCLSSCRFEKW